MKRFLLVLALAASAAPALAQVQLGVRAGVSAAALAAEPGLSSGFDDRLGVTGGVTAERPLSPFLALRAELVYTMKGGQGAFRGGEGVSGVPPGVVLDVDYALDYVEVPLLLVFNEPTSQVDLAVLVGPTLSFNVREQVDAQATGTINGRPITEEQAAQLAGALSEQSAEALDPGVTLGIRAVRDRLALEARFTLGLADVTQDENGTGFPGVKNRAFAVSLGYAL